MSNNERIADILKDLSVCMSLRKPQREALAVFSKVLGLMKWEKTPWVTNAQRKPKPNETPIYTTEQITEIDKAHDEHMRTQLERIRREAEFLTLTSFEREFPSLTFALATGVGKTRLMAAIVAYLHRVKGVNNFLVVAPNRPIYNKLRRDFNQAYPEKYVFSGLYDFVNQPNLIDGDNYRRFNPSQLRVQNPNYSQITIHIFNIDKLTHGRGKEAELARVMRLDEILGESYFNALRSLPDLCVMMDESHHYHAEQSFGVINDLNPMLGVEFTATPQIQSGKGKILFKNVVYEYSLAHALNDEMYVKEPTVWTREDFDPSQYTSDALDKEKLIDGIRLHIDTKARLDTYARNHGVKIIKPFVLVVAKDIEHSRQIREFLTSADFNGGYYADKVLEINSKQGKVESDENTELLLGLERDDNKIEIVLHVDTLKEGWDVTNLYTIIPLRASASETLTEQTIGRGLRLPYGKRTGDDVVDRLSIVSHDKYADIIKLANSPDSLVRRVKYIDPSLIPDIGGAETESVELMSEYTTKIQSENLTAEIASLIVITDTTDSQDSAEPAVTKEEIAKFVAEVAAVSVIGISKRAATFMDVRQTEYKDDVAKNVTKQVTERFADITFNTAELDKAVEKAIDYCVEALTGTTIPIPEFVINPKSVDTYRFEDFTLDVSNLNYHPAGDNIIGQELREDGESVEFYGEYIRLTPNPADSPEKEIAKYIIVKDNIIYDRCIDLIFKLIAGAKAHFLSYLENNADVEKVMRQQARHIAEYIYAQMNEHFIESDLEYSSTEVRPFSEIKSSFGSKIKTDDVYTFTTTVKKGEVPHKIFKGFKKACHTLYKFDSMPELEFARLCERDKTVIKWLRPSPKQFNIYYGKSRKQYEPDFVVETEDKIYLVEVKAKDDINDADVQEKARAGVEYCKTVSSYNAVIGGDGNPIGKSWEYALIADTNIQAQNTLMFILSGKTMIEFVMGE